MTMNARNRSLLTSSQWQELENQALIFKYMVSRMPIPSDLIFSIRKSMDSSFAPRPFPQQPNGWGCFQVGFGRKADPEPGRCRRTDGKKWRCSKEAFPDSKYCERHMHRGRNRSRKPVEVITTNPSTSISSLSRNPMTTDQNIPSYCLSSLSSSMAADTHHPQYPYYNTSLHPFLSPHSSSSRHSYLGMPPQNNSTDLLLDTGSYSHTSKDYRRNRYFHELNKEIDERALISDTSGTVGSIHEASLVDPWRLTPLRMGSSLVQSKQRSCSALESGYTQLQLQSFTDNSKQQEQHCFILGTDFKCDRPVKVDREEEPQKHLRHFFDEWPPKNRDSWLDLEEDRSSNASFSTTQLSISIPICHSRTQKDC